MPQFDQILITTSVVVPAQPDVAGVHAVRNQLHDLQETAGRHGFSSTFSTQPYDPTEPGEEAEDGPRPSLTGVWFVTVARPSGERECHVLADTAQDAITAAVHELSSGLGSFAAPFFEHDVTGVHQLCLVRR